MKSLRVKVFLGVLCGLLLVTAAAEVLLYRQAAAFAEKDLYTSLRKFAVGLSGVGYIDPINGFTLYPDWESRLRISPDDRAQFFEFNTADGEYITDSHNLGGGSLPVIGQHQGQTLVDYGNVVLGVYEYHFEITADDQPAQQLKLIVADNTDLLRGARLSTVRTLLYFTPIALIAAFLISWTLTTATLSSISRFTKRVQSYNRTNNSSQLNLDSIDKEMQPLGEALNKYIYQLNQHANLESKLLADTAHELRTPLGRMSQELELLKQASNSPTELLIHTENLNNTVSGLQAMADNMLMLYRIESGNYQPRLEIICLTTEIDGIVPLYQKKKNLDIEVTGDKQEIFSNRSVLKLVVTRLLNNAIQHAAGTRISIHWEANAEMTKLHIDDAGTGIPEPDREKIFDRHYRLEDHKKSTTSGTGLGLALVRLYANSVAAQTHCADSPLGGARFTVVFPNTAAASSAPPDTVPPNSEPPYTTLVTFESKGATP